MKRQLLSNLGLCLFSATLLWVSVSDCFAQRALPATEENEDAVARTMCVTLSDSSQLVGELDPMTTFRLTSEFGELVFSIDDFLQITLSDTGTAVVVFNSGDRLTGELDLESILITTIWADSIEIELEFIRSIASANAEGRGTRIDRVLLERILRAEAMRAAPPPVAVPPAP